MDQEALINLTIDLIHSYAQLLDQKGLTYVLPTDEVLRTMKVYEVRQVLKELIDLARTPL